MRVVFFCFVYVCSVLVMHTSMQFRNVHTYKKQFALTEDELWEAFVVRLGEKKEKRVNRNIRKYFSYLSAIV